VRRVAAGDASAFGEIVRHYQRPVFGFLGRMGLTQVQAEDVAQETFLRAWRSLGSFDSGRAGFSTWLFTIARNAALNEHARVHTRRETAVQDTDVEIAVCERPGPVETLEASRRTTWLQAALRRLQPADRTLLALVYTRELQLDAIARIEGCTEAAIKTRLHRARRNLERLLMENPDEYRH
jgi:RNA polymerase sigma-70 factor (ECF subfamily)